MIKYFSLFLLIALSLPVEADEASASFALSANVVALLDGGAQILLVPNRFAAIGDYPKPNTNIEWQYANVNHNMLQMNAVVSGGLFAVRVENELSNQSFRDKIPAKNLVTITQEEFDQRDLWCYNDIMKLMEN